MSVLTRRTSFLTAGSVAGVLLLASPALAHVTVSGQGAVQGGYGKIVFRVPTEEAVPTTSLQVTLPADAPIASVSVQPHPGWTWSTTTAKPATPLSTDDGPVDSVVTSITWTATAGGIKPGEFDEFALSAGPLPKASSMTFKALQTYADGSVVRWIETATPGGAEPEHPAPVLQLAAATGSDAAATSTGASAAPAADTPSVTAAAPTTTGSSGHGLAIAALAVAVLAALLAGAGLLRGRRPSRP